MSLSPITAYLWVGTQPKARHIGALQASGVRLIISMRGEQRPPAALQQPFQVLWLKTYDLFFTPIPMAVLWRGVQAALPVIAQGGAVCVHCQRGRHRSVAMAAAILIAQGYPAEEAMQLLRARRKEARPQTWYIKRQIKRFEKEWLKSRP